MPNFSSIDALQTALAGTTQHVVRRQGGASIECHRPEAGDLTPNHDMQRTVQQRRCACHCPASDGVVGPQAHILPSHFGYETCAQLSTFNVVHWWFQCSSPAS